jgi:hypothetical protein
MRTPDNIPNWRHRVTVWLSKPRAAGATVEMRTPDQYREFAAQCYRLAAEAKTEAHQKMMEEMARAWSEVAEQAEKREASR